MKDLVSRNSVRLIGTRTAYIILQCIVALTLKHLFQGLDHIFKDGNKVLPRFGDVSSVHF